MLSKADRAEVMKIVNENNKQLRKEFNSHSNTHSNTESETNGNVTDNTEAILELSTIIGGE